MAQLAKVYHKFMKDNYFKIGILIILAVFVLLYGVNTLNNKESEQPQNIDREQQDSETKNNNDEEQKINILPSDTSNQSTDSEVKDEEEDLQLIKLNFDLEASEMNDERLLMMNAVNDNPNESCQSIIKNESTKMHIYYSVVDNYNLLVSEYDQYRDNLEEIDNSLNNILGTINFVKQECAKVDYALP